VIHGTGHRVTERLCRPAIAMPVHLPSEFDLGPNRPRSIAAQWPAAAVPAQTHPNPASHCARSASVGLRRAALMAG
jgi:hypothetical protein